jgi:hypothetical protein
MSAARRFRSSAGQKAMRVRMRKRHAGIPAGDHVIEKGKIDLFPFFNEEIHAAAGS